MFALAQEKVPVITGNLKSGIAIEKGGSYAWAVSASSQAGSDPGGMGKNKKEYAGYVEFGSSHNVPRFFMTESYRETSVIVASDLKLIAAKLMRL
jgi:hypothetical protein